MTGEESALVRQILTRPADDTPRLVYADWLDEHDQADRAEFIRMSVEANRSTAPCYHDLTRPPGCPTCALHIRADALAREWTDGEINWERWAGLPSIGWACHNLTGEPRTKLLRTANGFRFRRGFVDEIRLPLSAFPEHARDLFAAHPITAVVLTDRESWVNHDRTHWGWWLDNPAIHAPAPDSLPRPLADAMADDPTRYDYGIGVRYLPGGPAGGLLFRSADAAHAALSAACVRLGRELAGLPPLE